MVSQSSSFDESFEPQHWSSVFPDVLNSKEGSEAHIKKLIFVGFSCITFLRNVFPRAAYEMHQVDNLSFALLLEDCGIQGPNMFVQWLYSTFEAIEKKYLREVCLAFFDENCEEVLETYTFKLKYMDDNKVALAEFLCSNKQTLNKKMDVRGHTLNLLRSIIILTQSMKPLPDNVAIQIYVNYYDRKTPRKYQPQGFQSVDPLSNEFENSVLLKFGSVKTVIHTSQFRAAVKYTQLEENVTIAQSQNKEELTSSQEVSDVTSSQEVSDVMKNDDRHVFLTKEDSSYQRNLDIFKSRTLGESQQTSTNGAGLSSSETSDYKIRCPCQLKGPEDHLLVCQNCGYYQHGVCFRILFSKDAPAEHVCELCAQADKPCTDDLLIGAHPIENQETCVLRRIYSYLSKTRECSHSIESLTKRFGLNKELSNIVSAVLQGDGAFLPDESRVGKVVNRYRLLNNLIPHYFSPRELPIFYDGRRPYVSDLMELRLRAEMNECPCHVTSATFIGCVAENVEKVKTNQIESKVVPENDCQSMCHFTSRSNILLKNKESDTTDTESLGLHEFDWSEMSLLEESFLESTKPDHQVSNRNKVILSCGSGYQEGSCDFSMNTCVIELDKKSAGSCTDYTDETLTPKDISLSCSGSNLNVSSSIVQEKDFEIKCCDNELEIIAGNMIQLSGNTDNNETNSSNAIGSQCTTSNVMIPVCVNGNCNKSISIIGKCDVSSSVNEVIDVLSNGDCLTTELNEENVTDTNVMEVKSCREQVLKGDNLDISVVTDILKATEETPVNMELDCQSHVKPNELKIMLGNQPFEEKANQPIETADHKSVFNEDMNLNNPRTKRSTFQDVKMFNSIENIPSESSQERSINHVTSFPKGTVEANECQKSISCSDFRKNNVSGVICYSRRNDRPTENISLSQSYMIQNSSNDSISEKSDESLYTLSLNGALQGKSPKAKFFKHRKYSNVDKGRKSLQHSRMSGKFFKTRSSQDSENKDYGFSMNSFGEEEDINASPFLHVGHSPPTHFKNQKVTPRRDRRNAADFYFPLKRKNSISTRSTYEDFYNPGEELKISWKEFKLKQRRLSIQDV